MSNVRRYDDGPRADAEFSWLAIVPDEHFSMLWAVVDRHARRRLVSFGSRLQRFGAALEEERARRRRASDE